MSDNEAENKDEKQDLIGVDQLAWLSDEEKQAMQNGDGAVEVDAEASTESPEATAAEPEADAEAELAVNAESTEADAEVEVEANAESTADQPGTSLIVNLDSNLSIRDIAELKDELNQLGENHEEVIFEAEGVERVDAATMQLLLGFHLSVTDSGKKVSWNKPSQAFCQAVDILGLAELLDIKDLAA